MRNSILLLITLINSFVIFADTEMPKYFFIMRGLSVYNERAQTLAAMVKASDKLDCVVVSTDKNIDEYKRANPTADWSQIRDGALKNNLQMVESAIKNDSRCIIYADMNIIPNYALSYVKLAEENQFDQLYFVIASMDYNHEKAYMKKHVENAAKEENQFSINVVTVTDETNNQTYHVPQLTFSELLF